MRFLVLTVFILLFSTKLFECESKNEVTKSLINRLGIKSCIVVDEHSDHVSIKHFAHGNTYTIYMNTDSFIFYLFKEDFLNVKTLVLISSQAMIKVYKRYFTDLTRDYVMDQFTWIIFDEPTSGFIYNSRNFYIPYNSEFILITPVNGTHYKIDDIYNAGYRTKSHRKTHHLGFWSQGKLQMTHSTKEQRRFNMEGEELSIITFNKCEDEKCLENMNEFILHEIGTMMNSTAKYSWRKTAGEDIIAISIAYTASVPYRLPHPENIWGPIVTIKGYFHIKNDIEKEYRTSAYFEPFSTQVWQFIFFSQIFSSIVFFFLGFWGQSHTCSLLSSFNIALRPLATMSNQCNFDEPENRSLNVAWISVQITASVLVPIYSAFVISYLTIHIPKLPFTNLETFLQDGTYKFSGKNSSLSHNFLKYSNDSIAKKITENLLIEPCLNEFEGIQKMCKEDFKYAFVFFDNYISKIPDKECNILKAPNPIFSYQTGLYMEKPYRHIYKTNLYRFYENGLRNRWQELRSDEDHETNEDYVPINTDMIRLLIYIVIFGNAAALVILVLEKLCKRQKSKKSNAGLAICHEETQTYFHSKQRAYTGFIFNSRKWEADKSRPLTNETIKHPNIFG